MQQGIPGLHSLKMKNLFQSISDFPAEIFNNNKWIFEAAMLFVKKQAQPQHRYGL